MQLLLTPLLFCQTSEHLNRERISRLEHDVIEADKIMKEREKARADEKKKMQLLLDEEGRLADEMGKTVEEVTNCWRKTQFAKSTVQQNDTRKPSMDSVRTVRTCKPYRGECKGVREAKN